MAVKIISLTKLQMRQYLNSKSKSKLYGDLFVVIYFWIIEFFLFSTLKKDGITEVPTLVAAIVAIGFTIPDLILKFIIERDNTVMDAFLKTRPVSQSQWEKFLVLSQFWKESNLVMPLALLPVCFLFIPPLGGFFLFIGLYLASVFGGYFVMAVKHRGTYLSEKEVKNYLTSSVKSANGKYVSGLQFRIFLRSKRLRTAFVYLSIIFYINCIAFSFGDGGHFVNTYIFLFIALLACSIPQWGFAVEANFFNGIWSRPFSIEQLLVSKYHFGILCGAFGGLLCLPFCLWSKSTSPYDILASVLFNCCCGNMFMLIDAYNCVPFDIYGNAFFNYQGVSSSYKAGSIITVFVMMGFGLGFRALPGWRTQVILSALGIAGLISYKPFFKWVVRRFIKNRYKYMEKYTSK